MNRINFEDRELFCVDCEKFFIWTSGEQFYFFSRGLAPVKRCLDCRQKRRLAIDPGKGVNSND